MIIGASTSIKIPFRTFLMVEIMEFDKWLVFTIGQVRMVVSWLMISNPLLMNWSEKNAIGIRFLERIVKRIICLRFGECSKEDIVEIDFCKNF